MTDQPNMTSLLTRLLTTPILDHNNLQTVPTERNYHDVYLILLYAVLKPEYYTCQMLLAAMLFFIKYLAN